MTKRFATFAAIIALSATTTIAAHAASYSDPAQDQRENAITAQLNRQQVEGSYSGGYGTQTYEGIMQGGANRGMTQEQVAQPPAGSSDLSIIE